MNFRCSGRETGAALIFETIALTGDLYDGCVVQNAVEHGCGEDGIAGESLIPAAERRFEVRINEPFS